MREFRTRKTSDEAIYNALKVGKDGNNLLVPKIVDLVEEKKSIASFLVWKTLKLGTGLKSADDFRKALKWSVFRISNWADDILGKPAFTVSTEGKEINLVVSTTNELTGKDGATTVEVFAGAARLRLEKCPAEVGPQLRLQYRGQPLGERLLIGMEPITDSDGILSVFHVEHDDDGLWLYGTHGCPDDLWNGDCRWVFALRK